MNTGDPWPNLFEAEARVRAVQAKRHLWASADDDRRFDGLYNLVCDPAFLIVAWRRVRANKGARCAGVDGVSAMSVGPAAGKLLDELRASLKTRRFSSAPVREKMIPKANGKLRPIFEADFQPCSYGFRPKRRAQDAIAEIVFWRPFGSIGGVDVRLGVSDERRGSSAASGYWAVAVARVHAVGRARRRLCIVSAGAEFCAEVRCGTSGELRVPPVGGSTSIRGNTGGLANLTVATSTRPTTNSVWRLRKPARR